MKNQIAAASEVIWLDAHHELSLAEMLALSGLSITELRHLVECEVLLTSLPVCGNDPAPACYTSQAPISSDFLALVRTASHLRDTFDLDVNGLTLTMRLLKRILELEVELLDLRAQRPR